MLDSPIEGHDLWPSGDPRLVPSQDLAVAVALVRGAYVAGVAAQHRDEILAFIADHPDAAQRSCPLGHLTGSAVVIDPTRGETLLMLHRKLGRWFQPGGHADGDTNLAAVALREATEETGIEAMSVVVPAIDIDVHRVEPPGEASHLHLDVRFLVLVPPGASEHGNEESLGLIWVDLDGMDRLDPPVDASTRRLVARGLSLTGGAAT